MALQGNLCPCGPCKETNISVQKIFFFKNCLCNYALVCLCAAQGKENAQNNGVAVLRKYLPKGRIMQVHTTCNSNSDVLKITRFNKI